ncbi:MAG TPA: hypothetical protein EYQ54_05695 [Myxococcales bacterium]|nr:hypothetical protein [Myxococcales bacterium]HIL81054.1 hypothetical protein [Myxococcales bacterium]
MNVLCLSPEPGVTIEAARGGRRHRLRDWNPDGYRDLGVRLDPGHGANPVGVGEVCMSARLREGGRIQGCESMDARGAAG